LHALSSLDIARPEGKGTLNKRAEILWSEEEFLLMIWKSFLTGLLQSNGTN